MKLFVLLVLRIVNNVLIRTSRLIKLHKLSFSERNVSIMRRTQISSNLIMFWLEIMQIDKDEVTMNDLGQSIQKSILLIIVAAAKV